MPRKYWLIIPFLAFGAGIYIYQSAWISLILYHLLLCIPLGLYQSQWSFADFFKGFRFHWAAIHLLTCLGIFLILTHLGKTNDFGEPLQQMLTKFGQPGLFFAIYFIIINPLFEEAFWRDLMASKSRRLTLEDVAFGVFHTVILAPFLSLPYIIAIVSGLIATAWIWRRIRWKENGLAIPWLGHSLGDAMFVAIVANLIYQ